MELIKSIAPVIVAGVVAVVLVLIIKKRRKLNDKVETYITEGISLILLVLECLECRSRSDYF